MNIGLYLRELRKRSKLSQLAVATSIGVSKFLVSDWEAPRVRIFADSLEKYLAAVGATDEERVRALRLAADPDGIPAETPPDDDFHLDLDDDVPHTTHGFPESLTEFRAAVAADPTLPAVSELLQELDDGIPDAAIRGFDRDVMQPLRDALPAAPPPPPPPTLVPPPSLTTSAPNVWSLVVGSCSRTSCGGDVVPVQDDELPRAWNQNRCQECGLERLEPRLRSVDDIPAMAEAETARRARGAA